MSVLEFMLLSAFYGCAALPEAGTPRGAFAMAGMLMICVVVVLTAKDSR